MSNPPSTSNYPYEAPSLPHLLIVSSYIYLLNVAGNMTARLIHADLIGYIIIGMVFGPPLANILPTAWLESFTALGYVGLLLLVLQGGLMTDLALIFPNIIPSLTVASTGIALPIVFSITYLPYALNYSLTQAFAAGASLSSTSLGTTLAVLSVHARASPSKDDQDITKLPSATSPYAKQPPDVRKTRLGTILITAAIADDVVALVLAAIVPSLGTGGVTWRTIVRPVLVSLAFVTLVPISTIFMVKPALSWVRRRSWVRIRSSPVYSAIVRIFGESPLSLFAFVAVASGFVAGAYYAGTSEVFGAYIAGCWLRSVGRALVDPMPLAVEGGRVSGESQLDDGSPAISLRSQRSLRTNEVALSDSDPFNAIFESAIAPLLNKIFAPLFFGSIGSSIPFLSLWNPGRVVWQGFVYAILMAVGKMLAGVWWAVWRHPHAEEDLPTSRLFTRSRGALFLGTALVARGEIALLVASLGRPVLQIDSVQGSKDDLYSIVMWAILTCTVGGAMGVGAVVQRSR